MKSPEFSDLDFDSVIIGAGAAGLMAAAIAGQCGKNILLLDHSSKIGEKIRISGGGRCNFTNLHTSPKNYISQNPHFCKSALSRYTQHDFLTLVESYGIAWHEKTKGQLFCDGSATQIITMLLEECKKSHVTIRENTRIHDVTKDGDHFICATDAGDITSTAVVVATGGLSIPKIGATGFGYHIAEKFGHSIVKTHAALVPLTFQNEFLHLCADLSGVSVDPVIVTTGDTSFEEAILFTHRGLSGPAILQISSYWKIGHPIIINLLPHQDVLKVLKQARQDHARKMLLSVIEMHLPKRLADSLIKLFGENPQMGNMSDKKLESLADILMHCQVIPTGTEGYRTAEVTAGGVNTDEISSKTFESKIVPGLYFVGEVLDVTGHLGGFNFQWAWSSGFCCGQALQ